MSDMTPHDDSSSDTWESSGGRSDAGDSDPGSRARKPKVSRRRVLAVGSALVAALGILAAIVSDAQKVFHAISWVPGYWREMQPAHDSRVLEQLSVRIAISESERRLESEYVTSLATNIRSQDRDLTARLYILDTVYVEAFVDSKGQVAAYAVIARKAPLPSIQIAGNEITLGETALLNPALMGPRYLATACGAKYAGYFEVSETAGAYGNLTFAVGASSSGYAKDETWSCPPDVFQGQPVVTPEGSRKYELLDFYEPNDALMGALDAFRSSETINMVAVTDGFFPRAIGIHPDELWHVDPDIEDIYDFSKERASG